MITRYEIDWKVPNNIGFFISTNQTGHSEGKYKSANFSFSVGDNEKNVIENIRCLKSQLKINDIAFMQQSHSNIILEANKSKIMQKCDAIFTRNHGISCAVLTADCIPILITEKTGKFIGCIHAGWRGLQSGIIENFFRKHAKISKSDFKVLLGPCISSQNYEVKEDIFQNFIRYKNRFVKNNSGNYYMDIRNIAYDILTDLGISDVTISRSCTYEGKFYSYRREKRTGRFISLIWFKNDMRKNKKN